MRLALPEVARMPILLLWTAVAAAGEAHTRDVSGRVSIESNEKHRGRPCMHVDEISAPFS
eukprot:6193485-Pleurochrysis_carterae.AAC.2